MKTVLEHITIDSVSKAGPVERLQDDVALVYDISRIRLPEEPKRMDCLLFAFCVKGQAEYTVDTIHHTISAGQIIIIGIKQVVSGVHFRDDCIGRGVFISENYTREILSGMRDLSSIFLFSRMHPVFNMNKEGIQSMLSFFLLIRQKISETDHRFRRDTVRALMQAFVYDAGNMIWHIIQSDTNTAQNRRSEEIFMKFIQMVEKNFRNERRVTWYAEQLSITPKYLSEVIRQISRETPSKWIDDFVTLELRVLLKNSNLSIKEIAERMHFPNQSFLGKFFKEHVGMSPKEYRKA